MSKVLHHKVVVALPTPLEPDSIYYVRAGSGFDIHVTNGAGVVTAYSLNANLELDGKVDKELGYSLLPNTEITRLATMATGATKNRADSLNADKSHTHTTADITDMSDSGKSVATGTPAQGRTALGLGTAATATLTTSKADPNEGRVTRSGDYGIGGAASQNQQGWDTLQPAGIYNGSIDQAGKRPAYPASAGMVIIARQTSNAQQMLAFSGSFNTLPAVIGVRSMSDIRNGDWSYMYHTGNTTLDPDGTLKASSPVVNLYTDKHDLHNDGQFGATPTVVRKSKGVYEITGTLGLRSEGWYLDTPSDRNGNKYFNIEWTQNITPEAEDGVVDEYRDDIIVTIETFERVWNKDIGLFENGAPMDINELQDRFVQLRFNEPKVEHEELMNENK